MKTILAVLLALSPAWAGAAAPLDADTLAMVTAFLKMETSALPVAHIPRFMAVDPESLPVKLRKPFEAKRLELKVLAHLSETKKHGIVRMPEANCSIPEDGGGMALGILKLAGFKEIRLEEEQFVEKETKCTQHDLMCEFSLKVLVSKKGKPPRTEVVYLLHSRDPLWALVARYQEGHSGETHFFGQGVPTCAPRLNP